MGYRNSVQSGNHSEAEVQHVKSDEGEQDYPGDSLHQIEPVAWIRICKVVGSRFDRDDHSIDRVVDERYKDARCFHQQDVWYRLQIGNGVVKVFRASKCLGIGVKVFKQKKSERNDTGKLMELAQDEGPAQTNSQECTPLPIGVIIESS